VEKEQETASFYLGLYPGVAPADIDANNKAISSTKPISKQGQSRAPTELKGNGDQRYLVQTWKDGSKCDLTQKPRTIEVQVSCTF
jgi:P pilus assembly chaperone PapD